MDQKKLYPVIMCSEGSDGKLVAALNVGLALASGADGVILHSRTITASKLVAIYRHVRELYPLEWIGIRFPRLSASTEELVLPWVIKYCPHLDAVWTKTIPEQPLDTRTEIFSDFSMPYKNSVTSGPRIRESCEWFGDIVHATIIRGQEKGDPPSMSLVSEMRKNLHAKTRLGVAGGIGVHNLFKFQPSADYFLVGRSVYEDEVSDAGRIAPGKVARIAALLHA